MKEFRTRVTPCLNCGEPLDAAFSLNGKQKPTPGSVSLCFHCGHIAMYETGLKLRELTGDEMVELAGQKFLLEGMAFIKFMRELKR